MDTCRLHTQAFALFRTIAVIVTAVAAATPAAAQMEWEGTQSSSWFIGNNWNPVGPPGPGDDVVIDTTSPNPAVASGAAASIATLLVGQTANGELTIQNGATISMTSGGAIGSAGASGSVTVLGVGAHWEIGPGAQLTVGGSGTGTLAVSGGATVAGGGTGRIGAFFDGSGSVLVSGTDSELTLVDELRVGDVGSGSMTIAAGGAVVVDSDAIVGRLGPGEGVVLVTGTGSLWSNSRSLTIGDAGAGELTVEDGAMVSNLTGGRIAEEEGSQGTVTVRGAGSEWVTGFTNVGQRGEGTLEIEAGGQVSTNADAVVGFSLGANGSAGVQGAGSGWTISGSLVVGYQSAGTTGSLLIDDGGVVETGAWARIGLSTASGSVVLAGNGSTWNIGEDLEVGQHGAGALTIGQGAAVNVQEEVLVPSEQGPSSQGELLVNGELNALGGLAVNANGWLGGAGEVLGNTTVTGTVAPGFPVGTLAITGDLSLDEDAILDFELDGPTDPGDMLDVSGDLTLDGTLQVTDLGGMTPGDYTLIEYGGVLTDNGLAVSGLPSGLAATVDTSVAGQVILAVEAVPDDVFADRFEE